MYKIRQTDDIDSIQELHALTFPADAWVGDDHEFWIATDGQDRAVGFASALYYPDSGNVYLSRVGVLNSAAGSGLGRRLLRPPINWARRIGAKRVVTYTTYDNYPSFLNLLKVGFRFYTPEEAYAGAKHYLEFSL